MFAIIGAVIVVGSVLGGFVLEGGHSLALHQPLEILIIGGAAFGSLVIATPLSVIKTMVSQILGILTGGGYAKKDYQDLMVMLY